MGSCNNLVMFENLQKEYKGKMEISILHVYKISPITLELQN